MAENLEFHRLEQVYKLSRKKGVNFYLYFSESDDSWYFKISSPAKKEEWIGKNSCLEVAIDNVVKWLNSL